MPLYEVIVVGLGAVGSAATWHLARLGAKVLGIDRYKPPHEFGSSTGETRLTRAAVGEGVEYSPLALRSNEIWRKIETTTGQGRRTAFIAFIGSLTPMSLRALARAAPLSLRQTTIVIPLSSP